MQKHGYHHLVLTEDASAQQEHCQNTAGEVYAVKGHKDDNFKGCSGHCNSNPERPARGANGYLCSNTKHFETYSCKTANRSAQLR